MQTHPKTRATGTECDMEFSCMQGCLEQERDAHSAPRQQQQERKKEWDAHREFLEEAVGDGLLHIEHNLSKLRRHILDAHLNCLIQVLFLHVLPHTGDFQHSNKQLAKL